MPEREVPPGKPPPEKVLRVPAELTAPSAPARKYPKLTPEEEKELLGYEARLEQGKQLTHSEYLRKAYLEQKAGVKPVVPSPYDAILDTLDKLIDALVAAIRRVWEGIKSAFEVFASWFKESILDPLWKRLTAFFDGLAGLLSSSMKSVIDAMMRMIPGGRPISPEQALPMFGIIAASVLAVSTLITSINAIHPLKDIIGDQTVAMIYKFLGFNELSSAFWSSIGTEVLDHPMRLWAREKFRGRVPDSKTADVMFWHGQISEDEWYKLHAYEGWADSYIDAHKASMWRNPSVRELTAIADLQAMSPEWIHRGLKQLGYKDEDAQLLAGVIARRTVASELNSLRSELMKETVEGSMTTRELESALKALGYRPEEIDIIQQIVAIRRTRKVRQDEEKARKDWQSTLQQALVEAYRRDLLDESELLTELLQAGVEKQKAVQVVYLEEIRKLPKPRRS